MTTATATQERKLPTIGLYQAQVDKVKYEKGVETPWGQKDKLTLIFNLIGTEAQNDGERPFSVWEFQNLATNVSFLRDGKETLTGFAKDYLQTVFGRVPHPLKSDEVDWEALAGTYASVMVQPQTNPNTGKTFAKISAYAPPNDQSQQEFNQSRLAMIYNGR